VRSKQPAVTARNDSQPRDSRSLRSGSVARRTASRQVGEHLFVLPMLILLTLVILVPTLFAVRGSFLDWEPGYSSPFVGLKNYRDVLGSDVFQQIMKNQLILLIGVPIWCVTPLFIAVLLHEGVPWKGLFRTIFFFPSILSPVIIGFVFRGMLRPDGSLNGILESIGLDFMARPWISDPTLVKPVIIFVVLWYTLGFGVLLFSAALAAVPEEQVDAARIDGANWLQRFRYVLLPSIMPTFLLNLVFSFATVFLLFGYVYVLTQGGPGYASTTIDFDIYQNSLRFGRFGRAAAESVILLLMMSIVVGGVAAAGRRLLK
jgi:ABC-type sugar transport system permease subunit